MVRNQKASKEIPSRARRRRRTYLYKIGNLDQILTVFCAKKWNLAVF